MRIATLPEARKLFLFVGEELALFGAFLAVALLVAHLSGGAGVRALVLEAAAVTFALQLALYLADLYDLKVALHDAPHAARLLKALGAVTLVCALALLLLPRAPEARIAAVAGLGAACTLALALRAALPDLGRRVALRARLFLVGEGRLARLLVEAISGDGNAEVVGSCGPAAPDLVERATSARAGAIVVAVDNRRGLDVRELLACRLAGFEVTHAISFAERALKRIPIELTHPSDLVFTDGFHRPPWLLTARRLLSLLVALVLFALALPLLCAAAILIKLDSPGPLFYSQERVGQEGRVFRMLKFRTMRVGAEQAGRAQWAQRNDPRITRVGAWLRRFRIDELPQLVNVLKGEMGVVGPRPERPQFVAELRTQLPYYDLRALVPPGITGWAQIRYPYAASLEEARIKLQYDLYYVKHLSVWLDLVILFHTAKVVLFGRGAR